jgi:hypothetical protein
VMKKKYILRWVMKKKYILRWVKKLPESCPRLKYKTRRVLARRGFSLVEVRRVELLVVCKPLYKNTLK